MKRRLVGPALLSLSAWGVVVLHQLIRHHLMNRWFSTGPDEFPIFVLFRPLEWLAVPLVFLSLYLCGTRGASRRESLLVGSIPALGAAAVLVTRVILLLRCEPSPLTMNFIARAMVPQYCAEFLNVAGPCLVSAWLYMFIAPRLAVRPSWVYSHD